MNKLSVASGIGAVLATVAFMSVFMPWFGETFFGYLGSTGWDIFYSGYNGFNDFSYYFLPVAIAVFGIFAAMIFVFAPKGNVTVLALAVLGVLMLVLSCFLYMQAASFLEDAGATANMAFGTVVSIVASAGVLVIGVVARK